MPDTATIKLPGIGVQKKRTVFIVVFVVVGVGGVAYYRRQKLASTAVDTGVGTAEINPTTGFPYGSAEDAAALAADSAYQNPTNYGGGGGPAATPAPAAGFTSNAQWTQAAQTYLVDVVGAPSDAVSAALGKYISGTPLNVQAKSYVQQAIASQGTPPVTGPNGFPPSYREETTAPATPSGGTGTVPNVADGYYLSNPGGVHYIVQAKQRWRLTATQVSTLSAHHTTFHPITDTTISKLPLRGIWQGKV